MQRLLIKPELGFEKDLESFIIFLRFSSDHVRKGWLTKVEHDSLRSLHHDAETYD